MSLPTVGVQLWPQHTSWPEVLEATRVIESLNYDSLWTWDHFYPHVGEYSGLNFEAWTFISALAAITRKIRLGVLVSAASFRHPALLAHQTATLDHVSGGRAAIGLGAGWFEYEHRRLGFELGTARQRLSRLEEAARVIRALLHGETVDLNGNFFRLISATLETRPLQDKLPVVIGGGGEQVTLGIVARYADIWNFYGPLDVLQKKNAVLDEHCARINRNPNEIIRSIDLHVIIRSTQDEVSRRLEEIAARNNVLLEDFTRETGASIVGPPYQVIDSINAYLEAGFSDVVLMAPAPYDFETFERLVHEVLPHLDVREPSARSTIR